jgi:hypothetical protein
MIEYHSNMGADTVADRRPKEADMTHDDAFLALLAFSALVNRPVNREDLDYSELGAQLTAMPAPSRRTRERTTQSRRRPTGPLRPLGASVRYPGAGVRLSRARGAHCRRPVTPATTAAVALLAALITVWLGIVAQFGDTAGASQPLPDRLAVVRVQAGETLQHVAARVAPDAPVGRVVERIRELNKLDSVSLDAGQTLIAPVG